MSIIDDELLIPDHMKFTELPVDNSGNNFNSGSQEQVECSLLPINPPDQSLNFMIRLINTYPPSILMAIIINSMNNGLNILFKHAVFKTFSEDYELSNEMVEDLTYSIEAAWYLWILFGIIIDGSSRYIDKRSYYMFAGFMQFVSMTLISIWLPDNYVIATIFLGVGNISGAFADVCVSAFIVEHGRLDLENGSSDLISLCWLSYGIGSTIGSMFLLFASEKIAIPRNVFTFGAIMGIL